MNLLKSKIFIFILLTGFISAPLSESICNISHEKNELQTNVVLNKVVTHHGYDEIMNFYIQNKIDNCEDPGISIFLVNVRNDKNNFYKQVLISPFLVPLVNEQFLEINFVSNITGKIFSAPSNNSNKLYKLNSLFLI